MIITAAPQTCLASGAVIGGSSLFMLGGRLEILLVKHLKASVLKQHEVLILSSSSSWQRRLTPFACIKPSCVITLPCPRPSDESKLNSSEFTTFLSSFSSPPGQVSSSLNKRQNVPATETFSFRCLESNIPPTLSKLVYLTLHSSKF